MSRCLVATIIVLLLLVATCALASPPPLSGTSVANAQASVATASRGVANATVQPTVITTLVVVPPDVGGAQNTALAVATSSAPACKLSAVAKTTFDNSIMATTSVATRDARVEAFYHALC